QTAPVGSPPSAGAKTQRSTAPRTKPTWKERRDLEDLTKRIPRLEKVRADLAAQLDTAGDDYVVATELAHRLDATIVELDEAETAWLELTEKMERLKNR
ncbi:MAG: ABC transporter C-terminal domain-containing protein, partial [Actinomycetota bacterium]|nr:ABC transporter C-terminal domain-containing protein [Actinomycetota bacterium]